MIESEDVYKTRTFKLNDKTYELLKELKGNKSWNLFFHDLTQSYIDINKISILNKIEEVKETPSMVMKRFVSDINYREMYINKIIAYGLPEKTVRGEINSFVGYWTEPTKSGKLERWQIEKTFELGRRLTTWFRNYSKFNKPGKSKIAYI
jgi:hypothetical protein